MTRSDSWYVHELELLVLTFISSRNKEDFIAPDAKNLIFDRISECLETFSIWSFEEILNWIDEHFVNHNNPFSVLLSKSNSIKILFFGWFTEPIFLLGEYVYSTLSQGVSVCYPFSYSWKLYVFVLECIILYDISDIFCTSSCRFFPPGSMFFLL